MAKLNELQRNAVEKQIEKEKAALERLETSVQQKKNLIETLRLTLQS